MTAGLPVVIAEIFVGRSKKHLPRSIEASPRHREYDKSRGSYGRRWLLFGLIGVPERSRTSDLALRRRLLYPAELPGQLLMNGGAEEDRTPDLVIANDALSQLSYGPVTNYTVAASTESSSRYSNIMACL